VIGSSGGIPIEHQASALKQALQQLVDRTPVGVSADLHLQWLIGELSLTSSLSPTEGHRLLQTAVQALKDLVTAYHEAGHVLAYYTLTPPDRVRLDSVCFRESASAGVEAGLTYTRIAAPWWPDPARRGEVVRELACILAGKYAEPALAGGVQLSGSDQDDQEKAAELLQLIPEGQHTRARQRAQLLLESLDLQLLPRLAAHLHERWVRGETSIPVPELAPLLTSAEGVQ